MYEFRSRSDRGRLGAPVIELPNADGFRFVGVRRDGTTLDCTVIKGADGMHRIKEVPCTELVGWFAAK